MTPTEIIAETCRITGVTPAEIKSTTRQRRAVYARTLAVHAIRSRCLGWTLQNIADLFGQHHTSVCYSLRRHEDLISVDPVYRANAETLLKTNARDLAPPP